MDNPLSALNMPMDAEEQDRWKQLWEKEIRTRLDRDGSRGESEQLKLCNFWCAMKFLATRRQ